MARNTTNTTNIRTQINSLVASFKAELWNIVKASGYKTVGTRTRGAAKIAGTRTRKGPARRGTYFNRTKTTGNV